jgi:OOP family OmpA-OmpF porin
MSSYLDWPRYSRVTWIVAGLLILLLLLLWLIGQGPASSGCCGKPIGSAAVAPPPAVSATPPKPVGDLRLVYQGGKAILTGVVPDQATHDRLLNSALGVYGAGNVIDKLRIDPAATVWSCVAKEQGLFAWLKSGLRSGITCNSEGVILTGVVASQAEHDARIASAKEFYGPGVNIIDKLVILAPLATVSKAADVKCGSSIAATVTFASDSAALDDAGKALLDAIAPCLTGPYEIDGHTDSTGDDEINLPLSQHRAESVKDYLVGKGVGAANLTTVGYGAERPVADNGTEEGKAQNRRIEFIKK